MSSPKGTKHPKMLGNQYWKLAHDFRKPKLYTPDELLDKAHEYAAWCEENPLKEMKVFGTGFKCEVPKMRAMTIQGFCLFANMSSQTFYEYEKDKTYFEIVTHIREMIYTQKFEGAAAEFLNPNIIARELGLQDKSSIEHSGEIKWIEERTYQTPDAPDEANN